MASKKGKRKFLFRWLKRLFLLGTVLVFLVISLQILISFAVPHVLGMVLAPEELELSLGRFRFSLLSGEVEFSDATFSSLGKDDNWIEVDHGIVSVAMRDLFRGRLRVERCVVDGVRFALHFDPNGDIVLPGLLGAPGEPKAVEEETPGGGMFPILPFVVSEIRVLDADVSFTDRTRSPPVEALIQVEVSASDFCSATRPNRFSVRLRSPGLFRSLLIEGEGTSEGYVLDAGTGVYMEGIDPSGAPQYLEYVGLEASDRSFSFQTQVRVRSEAVLEGDGVWKGWAELKDFEFFPEQGAPVSLEQVRAELDVTRPEVPSRMRIDVRQGRVPIGRAASGLPAGAGLVIRGTEAAPTVDEEAAPGPPSLVLERIRAQGLELTLRDEAVEPAQEYDLSIDEVTAENLPGSRTRLNARLAAPGVFTSLALDAEAVTAQDEDTVSAKLVLQGIATEPIESYLQDLGLQAHLEKGNLALQLNGRRGPGADGQNEASLSLEDLELEDGGELLSLSALEIGGANLNLKSVDRIAVHGLKARVGQESGGALRVAGLRFGSETPGDLAGEYDVQAGLALNKVDWSVDSRSPGGGNVELWLEAPGLIDRAEAKGTLVLLPSDASVDLEVDTRGIVSATVAPYLKGVALEERTLAMRFSLDGELRDGKASLHVENLELKGEDLSLFHLASAKVEDFELDAGQYRVGTVEVTRPRTRFHRGADGAMTVAGLRFIESETTADNVQAGSVESTAALHLAFEALHIRQAGIEWLDETMDPPVESNLEWDLSLKEGRFTEDRITQPFTFELRVLDTAAKFGLSGRLDRENGVLRAEVAMQGTGISPGPVTAYLPGNLLLLPEDGRLQGQISAEASRVEEGGFSAAFEISGLNFRNGEKGAPYFAAETVLGRASRIDVAGKVIAVDEIRVTHLQSEFVKKNDGSMEGLGFRLEPVAVKETEHEDAVAELFPTELLVAPKLSESLPLITLDTLNIEGARLTYRNESIEDPLTLEAFTIKNLEPIELLGDNPSDAPSMKLEMAATIDPLEIELSVKAEAAPFNIEPELRIAMTGHGFKGQALERLFPNFAERMDKADLIDGQMEAKMSVTLKADRRHALDFDFSRGLGLDLYLTEVKFFNPEREGVLAGLELLHVDAPRISPGTGEVHIRSIDLVKPTARMVQEPDGFYFLGIPLQTTSAEGEEVTRKTETSKTDEPGPEFRVDRFYISGIDFVLEDRTANPVFMLPITDIDCEVRNFTTRSFHEPVYTTFHTDLIAGDVALPARQRKNGVIRSLGNSVVDLAGMGAEKKVVMEERPMFAGASFRGRLAFYPELTGWFTGRMDALELESFRGLAKDSGITLNTGMLDGRLDLRFPGNGSMDVNARSVLTDLSMSEPDNGPIENFLRLPVSLDMAIFILRNSAGEVEVPLKFHVEPEGMKGSEIGMIATTAFQQLITSALPSYPIRLASVVTDLIPGSGDPPEKKPEESYEARFGHGSSFLNQTAREQLAAVIDRLEEDGKLNAVIGHRLGGGDIARAGVRANPGKEDILDMTNRLRLRRKELINERNSVAWDVRALNAAGLKEKSVSAGRRLNWLDRELGIVNRTLEEVLEMNRPGAERRAAGRTRKACLSIGLARLDAVRELLSNSGVEGIDDRLRLVQPRVMDMKTAGDEGGAVKVVLSRSKVR